MERIYRGVEIAALLGCMLLSGLSAYQSAQLGKAIAEAKLELIDKLVSRREFDAHLLTSNGRPN